MRARRGPNRLAIYRRAAASMRLPRITCKPELLFVGTEFALYFTVDGGQKWHRLRNGMPTIAVKDLCVQQLMSDLLIGTFGRGFYLLDDYSPLRT